MDYKEIDINKKHGDFVTVGAILGITSSNVSYAFRNKKASRHDQVKEKLVMLITTREQLING